MKTLRAILVAATACAASVVAASAIHAARLLCPDCRSPQVTEIGQEACFIKYYCHGCRREFYARDNPGISGLDVIDELLNVPRAKHYDFSWTRRMRSSVTP